jgi:dipeptidyl aminopeptidase/acylaminoacyl peptidase
MYRSLVLCALLCMPLYPPGSPGSELPELIPREILFGNPTRTQARIAPDGNHLSWLAPSADGVLNVWIQTADWSQPPRQVTDDRVRGIRFHTWSEDSQHVLYLQDLGGDENWHLYAVDLEGGEARDLTPFEGVRAQNLITDPEHPGEVLIGLNRRDRRTFDMHRIDLASGEVVLDTENPGDVIGWRTDADFRIRAAVAADPRNGDKLLRVRDAEDQPWRLLTRFPFGENVNVHAFDASGEKLFVSSSLGVDKTRLLVVGTASGETLRELARHARSDVGAVLLHPTEHRVQAVEFDYQKPEWQIIDENLSEDFGALAAVAAGSLSVADRTLRDDRWVVSVTPDDGPVAYYLYDRPKRRAERLFVTRPELENYRLVPMRPVVIEARDGLELPSYLSLPASGPRRNLPMVLLVHGGPTARDRWRSDPRAQWLANRGYAVLQVNYRGSTGFGKAFQNAGNGEWGVGAMQHDLTDAVHWAIEQGIADPKRTCIYGGSYGGYAVLAGLAFTPELYACGVDVVGPSHLKTLLASIPPYWAPRKKELVLLIGDVEKDEELNRRLSPLFHADKIRAPLMVLQGANDPRVKIAESDQIVAAMRANDLPVTYVVYPDEGHGFARPENRLDANARIEQFFAAHLGGRAEPFKRIPGSTAELR